MKPKKHYFRLRFKITTGILVLLCLFMIPLGYYIIDSQRNLLLSNLKSQGQGLAALVAEASAAPIEKFSYFRLEELAVKVEQSAHVAFCEIYDIDGVSLVRDQNIVSDIQGQKKKRSIGKNIMIFESDVLSNQNRIGKVEIGMYLDHVHDEIKLKSIQFVTAFFLALILITLSINLFLHKMFVSPVIRLSDATKALSEGNFVTTTLSSRQDEIGQLSVLFNQMSVNLKTLYQNLENKVAERTQKLEQINVQLLGEISERKKAEQELKTAKEAAEAANKYKSIFVANISHEIRTPLISIIGYTQILKRQAKLDPDASRALDTIEKSGDHLLSLINEILDLSKIEAGKIELKNVDFDLYALLLNLSRMFDNRCKEKKLSWSSELSETLSQNVKHWYVTGDEGKLRQVLINLLSNAIKFTSTGGITLRVTKVEADRYRFEVSDTGLGISIQDHDVIFEPFAQADSESYLGGTGLGLSISKHYTALMGGKLEYESMSGKGTCFYFTIDLKPVAQPGISEAMPDLEFVKAIKGERKNALVVDDDPESRILLCTILGQIGMIVLDVDDGEKALAMLDTHKPDIVFMDRFMPGKDGIEVSKQIKNKDLAGDLKIVMITAGVFAQDQTAWKKSGIDQVLIKPFKPEQIYACLHEQLHLEFEFEQRADPDVLNDILDLRDFKDIGLPKELLRGIAEDAEFCKISDMKKKLTELASLGEAQDKLSQLLYGYVKAYRLDQVTEILSRLKGVN